MICVEGVALAPAVGACGMWKEEEDGGRVWITCLDRRGRAAWRRVTGEEAALQARSEGFNLERKAETWEMWLLVRGRGGEVNISVEAENLESLQRKNWRAKCHQTQTLIQSGLWTVAVAPSRLSRMHTIL